MKTLILALATAFLLMNARLTTAEVVVEVPKEVLNEMELLVGDWEAKGTVNGQPFTGTYSAKWAPAEHCLILASSLKGAIDSPASGIGGWSPDRNQYVETWYHSDGTCRTVRYSLGGQKGVWTGKVTMVAKDGKKTSGKVHLRGSDDEFRGGSTTTVNGEKTVIKYVCRKK